MRKAAAARTTTASRSTANTSARTAAAPAVRTATNRNSPEAAPAVKTASKLTVVKSAPAAARGAQPRTPQLVRPAAVLAKVATPVAAPVALDPRTNQFRQMLMTRRQELSGNLEDTKFDTLARMGRVAEDDQAQLSHEEFISLQRNSMDYQALRQVNAAIERINTGEYGVCAHCDEPISEKRLKAIPWAKYCVVCQDRVQAQGGIELEDDDSATSEAW